MQFFKVAFFCRASSIKVTIFLSPTLPATYFRRHSLKLLSPTLPILMNWILWSHPPLSSDPDIPQNLERAPVAERRTGNQIYRKLAGHVFSFFYFGVFSGAVCSSWASTDREQIYAELFCTLSKVTVM